jgi:hypothetical protein
MGRPQSDQALDELFATDAELAVLSLLQQAHASLSAVDLKQTLRAGGVAKVDVERAWPSVQRKIRHHANVVVEGGYRYRWVDGPSPATVERDAVMPIIRALAELAIEVEELAVNQASAQAITHRVRARARLLGLKAIERAGSKSTLDRARHEPVGQPIEDGSPVVVMRPGYVWSTPTGDVLIARAVVQNRS